MFWWPSNILIELDLTYAGPVRRSCESFYNTDQCCFQKEPCSELWTPHQASNLPPSLLLPTVHACTHVCVFRPIAMDIWACNHLLYRIYTVQFVDCEVFYKKKNEVMLTVRNHQCLRVK